MTTYSAEFSCELPIGSADDAAKAMQVFEAYKEQVEEDDNGLGAVAFDLSIRDAPDNSKVLWFRSDEGDSTDQVCNCVLMLAENLNLTGLWGFDWSYTCSRQEPGAFGGGAVVIDLGKREVVKNLDTKHWLEDLLEPGASSESTEQAAPIHVVVDLVSGDEGHPGIRLFRSEAGALAEEARLTKENLGNSDYLVVRTEASLED